MHGSESFVSEPAFEWWTKHALKKRNIIINKVHARMAKKNTTFGIDISVTVLKAEIVDTIKNKIFVWVKGIQKELTNVCD